MNRPTDYGAARLYGDGQPENARAFIGRVVSEVVPTHPALVSYSQRRIVEISAHERW
jgi:hypothetical protein